MGVYSIFYWSATGRREAGFDRSVGDGAVERAIKRANSGYVQVQREDWDQAVSWYHRGIEVQYRDLPWVKAARERATAEATSKMFALQEPFAISCPVYGTIKVRITAVDDDHVRVSIDGDADVYRPKDMTPTDPDPAIVAAWQIMRERASWVLAARRQISEVQS